ncbi:bifunctional helix-turn-helix transcriptional regulator/GNAT family N-acetyltransferase [Streptomyces sulfonofaciens]|uniref:bifunctional helix-turn-helix transcriptional regulator/GNAT family N-acetyltransferase n=1 Tax=Streptomyces sulfonofaciens TaxID=68272 RepID=UPI0016745EA2|nr:bifunctional helix-turn-helix transcriptional regulator/GNAT family N-acetyltransferase [Streptomyces sulfonofaciens]
MPIDDIRAFNRFYTNLIGALDYGRRLYVPYTLTEARVLYELAHSPRTDAADLRGALSLDAGYLSRLLAKFEKAELVERAPSPRDPRRQSISLTGRGRSTAELLDERSRESVGALLGSLPARDRPRLTAAMRTIQDILSEGRPPRREDVLLRAPGPGDLGWIIQRNAALYAAEYGWNTEYEALVARIVADFAESHDPALERVWMAELDGRPVGCVMCVRDTRRTRPAAPDSPPGTARLRLLLVEPDARGLGIGDRLVRTCIEFARDAGYGDMVLWTNDILHSARSIYRRHGFTLTAEQPHRSFGVDLTGQDWHLPLRATGDGSIPGGEG